MSTVDPTLQRRRPAREPGPLRLRPGLWLLALVYWSMWLLFAYSLADAMRYPIGQAYLPPALYPDNVAPPWLAGLFVGSTVGFIAGFVLSYALNALFGLGASSWGQLAASLLAWTVGFWRGAADSWVAPPRVGRFAESAHAQAADWGALAWVGWSAQYWIPALLLLSSLGCAWLARRAHGRHVARGERMRRLLADGRCADAVVTEVHDTGLEIYSEKRLRFVVKFADHAGVERWTTKTGLFESTQWPRVGDPARVWFYPDRAGDEEQLLVGFADRDEPIL